MSEIWNKKDMKVVVHEISPNEQMIALKVVEKPSTTSTKFKGFGRKAQKETLPYKLFAVLEGERQMLIAESNCLETLKDVAMRLPGKLTMPLTQKNLAANLELQQQ